MPFDPLKPAAGSPVSSAELRSQFNALHDEVTAAATLAQLNDASNALTQDIQAAIDGSSANSNAVGTLSISSGDFNVQSLIDKMNELILALRR